MKRFKMFGHRRGWKKRLAGNRTTARSTTGGITKIHFPTTGTRPKPLR
jgi:hypothetical protein